MKAADLFRGAFIPEQDLVFGDGFPCADPKTGLAVYGPYSQHHREVRLAVIGDSTTADQTKQLLDMCRRGVDGDPDYPLWKQDFPGTTAGSGLRFDLIVKPEWVQTIATKEMQDFERIDTLEKRIQFAVDLFCRKIQNLREREDSPHVFLCAPPRRMMDLCIPLAGERGGRRGRMTEAEKQIERVRADPRQRKIWEFGPDVHELEEKVLQDQASDNFHHLLKARAMKMQAPTQFLRPYTLGKLFAAEKGALQDRATICWNLTVALYYKGGGRPWKLKEIPQGTCFVGVTFYRERFSGDVGTSLAQVFTPEGEGLVLRGEKFKWQPRREPHLSRDASRRLVEKVVENYVRQTESTPTRLVVHKSSKFSEEETAGMLDALTAKGVARHDFVTIASRSRNLKAFRVGYHPPLRGTMIVLPDESRLLFTRGFIPALRVYPGARVPRPLEIRFGSTDSSKDEICREILALTRLNWNTADFAVNLPMTLEFARGVGEILKQIPAGISPESKYLYYM